MRRFRSLFLVLPLLLAACGGGGDAGVAGGAELQAPAAPLVTTTQQIGAEGGTLTAQNLSITLPPGAVAQPVNITIAEVAPGSGEIARFELTPVGLALAAPTEIRYTSASLPAQASFFWEVQGVDGIEQWLIPSKLTGNVLTAQLSQLGYLGTIAARANRNAVTEKAKAVGGDNASLVIQEINCQGHVQALANRLKRISSIADMALAQALYQEMEAIKLACVGVSVELLQTNSCNALQAALFNASVTVANDFAGFQSLAVPLFAADAAVQNTGAECANADTAQVGPTIEAKFGQFLDILQGQLKTGKLAQTAGLRDMRVLMGYEQACLVMDLDKVCSRLTEVIYPDLLDGMRRAAFDACRNGEGPLAMSQFYQLGSLRANEAKFFDYGRFRLDAVEADLSFCTNPTLALRVVGNAIDFPEEITALATTITPRVALGDYNHIRQIQVPRNGALEGDARIQALRCPDGSASAADIVARIGTHEVARRSLVGDAYPVNALLDLVVSRTLAAIGLDPALSTGFVVQVRREGGGCSDGDKIVLNTPFTLFEVRVNLESRSGKFRGRLNAVELESSNSATESKEESRQFDAEILHEGGPLAQLLRKNVSASYLLQSESRSLSYSPDCSYTEVTHTTRNTTATSNTVHASDTLQLDIDTVSGTWRLAAAYIIAQGPSTNHETYTFEGIRGNCSPPARSPSTVTREPTGRVDFTFTNPTTNQPLSGFIVTKANGRRAVQFNGQAFSVNQVGLTQSVSVVIDLEEEP